LLLSPSVCLMQKMLDICESFADDCDMRFNCTKSFALRIGPRFLCNYAALTLCGEPLIYATSVKYLGVYLTAAKSFKCSYDHIKLKFYRTFNALYSRSKASNSERVCLELFRSYCLPFLLYAVESTARKAVRMLNRCIDSAVMKIFKLKSFENTAFIRMCVGLSDVGIVIKNRFLNFISKLQAQHYSSDLLDLCFCEL